MSAPPLNYELRGDPSAPPVVFLHGFMGNALEWIEVIRPLSSNFFCMTVDLPGHGKSLGISDEEAFTISGAAQGVVRVMEEVGIIPAAIAGYSMGGRLALYLAVHHAYACSSLIVESATPGIRGDEARLRRKNSDEKLAEVLEKSEFEDFLRKWYCQPVFSSLSEDAEKLKAVLEQRRLNVPSQLARSMRGMSVGKQTSLWRDLTFLDMPVLLLAGKKDEKYVEIVKAMSKLLPRACVKIVPGVGHNVHLENPSVTAGLIEHFL